MKVKELDDQKRSRYRIYERQKMVFCGGLREGKESAYKYQQTKS